MRIVPGEQEAREGGDSNLPSGGREGDSLGPTLENPGHGNWKNLWCQLPLPLSGAARGPPLSLGTRSLAVLLLVTGSLKCDH